MLIVFATAVLAAPAPAAPVAPLLPALTRTLDDYADAVAEGRAALIGGDLTGARRAFERAEGLDAERASFWLLRLQAAEGGYDEVLGTVSKRRRGGDRSDDLAYLSGWALLSKAQAEINGGGSGNVAFLLQDAATQLGQAADADADRYGDALIGRAVALRLNGSTEEALEAGRKALESFPTALDALDVVGRGALATAAPLAEDEAQAERFGALLAESRGAFEAGLDAIGSTRDALLGSRAAQFAGQLATVELYAKDNPAAAKAYALAIGWDPAAADFGTAFGVLERDAFIRACEDGAKTFLKRYGKRDQRDATTQWWLGYGLFTTNEPDRMEQAVEAFESAVAKWPGYTNSWYYLFRLNYDLKQTEAAITALREMRSVAKEQLAGMVQADAYDISRLEGLVGQSFNAGRLEDSAEACRVLVLAQPENDRFWNNLGLFLRDAGDVRASRAKRTDEVEWAAIQELWEESWTAYARAVELDPESAPYLNDAAVLLHYNLQRDYDKALDMYAKATELAAARMEEDKFESPEEKDVWRLALRDSRNNRRALLQKIEREKQGGEDGETSES